MSKSYPNITVYGATGHTGTLVCRELARRGIDFAAAGRNLERLQKLSSELGEQFGVGPTLRQAEVGDWDSLAATLGGTEVLINCAGPFAELGPPVARAAVRTDTHYLDTTGEQEYIRWMEEELDVDATRRRLALLPACAFEYATGSLAAAFAIGAGAREVVVSYGVSNFATSAGTKRSIVRSIAEEGVTYVEGERVRCRAGEKSYEVPLPDGGTHAGAWFPGGEPIFVPALGDVRRAESCLRVGEMVAKFLRAASGSLSGVSRVVKPIADRLIELVHDETGRGTVEAGSSPFEVVAFDPVEEEWYASVSGHDPYPTTARLIVEAASRMREMDRVPGGLKSPPELFDADEFAEAADLEVRVRGD